MKLELMRVTSVHVLALGFLIGIVFPALLAGWRTPPSGNEGEVGAVA